MENADELLDLIREAASDHHYADDLPTLVDRLDKHLKEGGPIPREWAVLRRMHTANLPLQVTDTQPAYIRCTASNSCVWSWILFGDESEATRTTNGISMTAALDHARNYVHAEPGKDSPS